MLDAGSVGIVRRVEEKKRAGGGGYKDFGKTIVTGSKLGGEQSVWRSQGHSIK